MLLAALILAGHWWPTGGSYPAAENERVVRAATETAQRNAAKADCVVVVDGSSIFSHAFDSSVMREELVKAGHQPCVLSLALLGGEHLELEWMAERLRKALPAETRQRLDALPMLWVKEAYWTYESHPARFVALNEDTPRTLAQCEPGQVMNMLWSLHDNWKADCAAANLKRRAAWVTYPWDQTMALVHQGMFNLFHVGQLERLVEPVPGPQYHVLGEEHLTPLKETRTWWADRPGPDAKFEASSRYSVRPWFERMLATAPLGWPQRKGFQLVLATMHAQNRTVPEYTATLADLGQLGGKPLILASTDAELRKELNDPLLWRDHTHLEATGAVIYTRWLAGRLLPMIATAKEGTALP